MCQAVVVRDCIQHITVRGVALVDGWVIADRHAYL